MVIGINCGHTVKGTIGAGASKYIDESDEVRAVGYPLMEMLRQLGHTVIDCTDDYANSVSDNLSTICSLANAQPLDIFISLHFNAGGGRGTEVFTVGAKDVACADRIKDALVCLGFKNRGIKDGSHLYVVRHTNAPAALVEVCFVDSDDAELYKGIGAEKVAKTICYAIVGEIPNNKEDLTVSQYEELKNMISSLSEKIDAVANPMVYNYIDNNMPEWAKPTIQKLVDKGILKGNDNGLDLTEDLMRILVINDRTGLYD